MKNKLTLTFLALLISSFTFAQQVKVLYEIVESGNDHTVKIYLHSNSAESMDIQAVNFSVVHPEGCVALEANSSMFNESWTDYLESGRAIAGFKATYNNEVYVNRWQYGNADPAMPNTAPVTIPGTSQEPLLVLEQQFKGACADFYMEHESENPFNQLAASGMQAVTYEISHPERKTVIVEPSPLQISAFPNPAADFTNLEISGGSEDVYTIRLSDMTGRVMMEMDKEVKSSETVKVDMRNIAAGVYVLEAIPSIEGVSGRAMKIVKQ